jgi:bifunctional non-homologous end joining protein LigD
MGTKRPESERPSSGPLDYFPSQSISASCVKRSTSAWSGLLLRTCWPWFWLIVSRDGDRVRLFTRNGYDWTSRYPLIVEAARRIRMTQFVLDGEAVLLGVDGISDFDGLYSGQHNDEIQLYAFDILALDGDDLRKLPLHLRKTNLARLARRADGIHLAPFEQGEIGPDLFRAACDMMLEGLVSKRRDSRYRPGPSRDWIKIKNPKSPAMNRAKDAFS